MIFAVTLRMGPRMLKGLSKYTAEGLGRFQLPTPLGKSDVIVPIIGGGQPGVW